MTFKGKKVEIIKSGSPLSVVKYVGDEDHKSFAVRTADLKVSKKQNLITSALG